MNSTVNVVTNNGGIVVGDGNNVSYKKTYIDSKTDGINWATLTNEINALKTSSDSSIKKFSNEASDAVKKKDKKCFIDVLKTWLPCIGTLIESSYYIIEIAHRFNIKIG